jgi:serine/threonine protein kinase
MMAEARVPRGDQGVPLIKALGDDALPLVRALRIAIAVGEALKQVHQQGRVFGQLHPSQVSLSGSRAVLSAPKAEVSAFMSPEQLRGEKCDERSDVFSLGALLYRLVAGRDPFRGGKPGELRKEILHRDPPLPQHLPEQLGRTLRLCLDKRREHRFQRLQILLAELKLQALRCEIQPTEAEPGVPAPGPVVVPIEPPRASAPDLAQEPAALAPSRTPGTLCPKCASADVRESRPRNALEKVAAHAGVSLLRCHRCYHRFMRFR